ncbi:MAG: MaoC family dehydratase N-terminal domain-containing protein [Pseudonocardia sp.]|nr:MaoC family dehydratase N-terminal domain-containing protein [Pseudonocardia sp.]
MTVDLHAAVDGWSPEPLESTETIGSWPTAAFSALLELPGPAAIDEEPLPPGWHWFHFLEPTRLSDLGDDGHPGAGRFLPPIPDRRRMIAGGRLHVRSPILLGDTITRRTELASVVVKDGRSGQLAFVTTRTVFRRGAEILVAEEQDVVYRSQPAGVQRAPAAAEPEPVPDHDWQTATRTTPQLLFRFSALTYNTHRIHYDQPYVTGVEGYPGLVVHGPLLALLLLEIPRRMLRRRVARFDYRLSSPVFCGATVLTHGRSTERGLTLSAMAEGGRTSITGRASLT